MNLKTGIYNHGIMELTRAYLTQKELTWANSCLGDPPSGDPGDVGLANANGQLWLVIEIMEL